jgi:hypothetical protein
MLVIIKKDDATSVSREVEDMAEARQLALGGMPVFIQREDGSTELVTADGEAIDPPPSDPVDVTDETQAPSDEPSAD